MREYLASQAVDSVIVSRRLADYTGAELGAIEEAHLAVGISRA